MSDSEMIENVAKAIYGATDPLSGDTIATVIIASEHLFPGRQHTEGNSLSKAYQLAAMDVCRAAARAAIEVIEPLVEQAFRDGLWVATLIDIDPDRAWQQSKARASLKEQEEGK